MIEISLFWLIKHKVIEVEKIKDKKELLKNFSEIEEMFKEYSKT